MASDVIRPSQRKDLADKTPQEAFEILKGQGVKLTGEQLEMAAGGDEWTDIGKDVGTARCPKCGQVNLVVYPDTAITCGRCGHTFTAECNGIAHFIADDEGGVLAGPFGFDHARRLMMRRCIAKRAGLPMGYRLLPVLVGWTAPLWGAVGRLSVQFSRQVCGTYMRRHI